MYTYDLINLNRPSAWIRRKGRNRMVKNNLYFPLGGREMKDSLARPGFESVPPEH